MKISKLICINVPVTACNLKCHYCYIGQQNEFEGKMPDFKYSVEHMIACLSAERLGGICIINLTGGGETLLPQEMPSIIKGLLENGHYLEVVTNGTVTKRFNEIAQLPYELLKRLEFKFSFHYLELLRTNKLEQFFENVDLMKTAGCSFTIEIMPNDELIPYIEDIKKICLERVGALCQVTVGRTDTSKGKGLLTKLTEEEYVKIWSQFESTMFDFKMKLLGKRRREFCYAGAWSLYVDLGTGNAKSCYGQLINQNIFADISKPIKFEPVGCACKQPFCYNGHAFLSLGLIPELDTPTYADIRNRKRNDGTEWLQEDLKEAFCSKLKMTNKSYTSFQKSIFWVKTPIRIISNGIASGPAIKKKIIRYLRKKNGRTS